MATGALVAALGLVAFVAIVTRPGEVSAPVVGTRAAAVTVDMMPAQLADPQSQLGAGCDGHDLSATAVATEGTSIVVVTDESASCARAMLTLSPDVASVRSIAVAGDGLDRGGWRSLVVLDDESHCIVLRTTSTTRGSACTRSDLEPS